MVFADEDVSNFTEYVQELLNKRAEEGQLLSELESNIYSLEERHLRYSPRNNIHDISNQPVSKQGEAVGPRDPKADEFIFSNSSTTLETALKLRRRRENLRMRRQERLRLSSTGADANLSAEASTSSDTDPEAQGIAAFEAAAKRDAELREQFKKDYERSHSDTAKETPA